MQVGSPGSIAYEARCGIWLTLQAVFDMGHDTWLHPVQVSGGHHAPAAQVQMGAEDQSIPV